MKDGSIASVSRRSFIALAAAAPLAASAAAPKGGNAFSDSGKVRFLAFADIHYCPGVWPHPSVDWLGRVLARAESEKTDFTIHLGDFVHRVDRPEEIAYVKHYNSFSQPTYHVIGNHDGERGDFADALKAYGLEKPYYSFDRGGYRFIVGDPNYFLEKGEGKTPKHFEKFNFHQALKRGEVEKVYFLPDEQMEWLRRTVAESPFPCVFFSHERLASLKNGGEIREIFDAANREIPGKVRLVINGHDHADHVGVQKDIVYFSLNSASYFYYAQTHDKYPADFVKESLGVPHTLVWNDPLSSVITLDRNGVKIVGSVSTYKFGVDPVKAGLPAFDALNRPAAPIVSTFEFTKEFKS